METGPEVAATMGVEGCACTSRVLGRGDVRVELLHWRSQPAWAGAAAPSAASPGPTPGASASS